jgi:hypothetical protein
MDGKRFSLEEFAALFSGRFESQEQLLREYRSFLAVFDQLEPMPVPALSEREKAEIFRRSWQSRHRDWSWAWTWVDVFRRPAVAFAAGIVLGCTLMFMVLNGPSETARPASLDPATTAQGPLTVERMRYTQVYKGKLVERLYPDIENPRIVLEKTQESSTPQRVLYGTLNDGEVYVVWNL